MTGAPFGTGSRPADQAPAGLDASRVDPSRSDDVREPTVCDVCDAPNHIADVNNMVGRVDTSRELTALSYWLPKVEAAGLPVPQTHILRMPQQAMEAVGACLWGEPFDEATVEPFVAELREAAKGLGAPFFLRTDHTSGKHEWRSTCFVEEPERLGAHIFAIAEFSECASLIGLPWHNWAVREMLPTVPVGVCPNYGDMPVCKEFRFFVDGGEIECCHPYWPRFALEQGGCNLTDQEYAALCTPEDEAELRDIASRAGLAVGGRWSVDLLATERGWFLTDMAEAGKSYHWPECARDRDAAPRGREAAEAEGQQPGPKASP